MLQVIGLEGWGVQREVKFYKSNTLVYLLDIRDTFLGCRVHTIIAGAPLGIKSDRGELGGEMDRKAKRAFEGCFLSQWNSPRRINPLTTVNMMYSCLICIFIFFLSYFPSIETEIETFMFMHWLIYYSTFVQSRAKRNLYTTNLTS